MKLVNRKYITGWVAVLIMVLMVGVGCDDPYSNRIDYTKLQIEETELRMAFYEREKSNLMEISTDSVDKMDTDGWVSFEIEKGSSDSVLVGKRVSFKYTYHYMLRDEETGEARLSTQTITNVGSPSLATYTVGSRGQQDTEVLDGVDKAIRHMYLYGKSYIIMSHSLAYSDYYPIVAEIEIVSMDLD